MNYTYGDTNHDHAVTQMGSDSYSYDNNGNQVTRNVSGSLYALSYDAENHMVGVTGAATATFVYDGDGNGVKATVGTTTTTYVGSYFEWVSSTSNMKKYYYAGATRVAMRTGSSTINYLLGDHLGSQAITTNSSGVKSAEVRYYPWGNPRYTSGTTPTTFKFTGQRFESAIGLYFYNARWYDSSAGRFISADTVIPDPGNSQAWDRYAYTLNNPLRYTDPSGHNAYCDNENSDPEECAGMRQGITNINDSILFEYRGPLHETDDYRFFGDYRGKWDYGDHPDIWHVSIDAYDDLGTNVYPVLPGEVTNVGWEASLGNYIVIKHETEYGNAYSVYGHLGTKGENGILFDYNDEDNIFVDKNTPIGTLGKTSDTISNMEPHLHFEIRFETNVNAGEGIIGERFWAFDSSWVYDFFDLGQIYGYVDNATLGKPPLP